MTYDPNDPITPEQLEAINALRAHADQPSLTPLPPDPFATADRSTEGHLGRIADALESIAEDLAAINQRDSMRGCCRGCR